MTPSPAPWFGLYLPQVRIGAAAIVERARQAEAAGFDSLWLMDHLAAPGDPSLDTLEGWTLAAAIAVRTDRIRIGHLTTCDPFRHPAVLAKMVATVDALSGGRVDLGLGWGSVPAELERFGIGADPPATRAARLGESIAIVRRMLTGEPFDFDGDHFSLRGAQGRPTPVQERVPLHLGGGGVRLTMPLVREHADWWNCPGYAHHRLDELRPLAGRARVSVQRPIGLAATPGERDDVAATLERRFGAWGGLLAGTPDEVADGLCSDVQRGVEGFVLAFHDFGAPETLQRFTDEVVPLVRGSERR